MTECPNCGYACQPDDSECPQCGTDFAYIKTKQAKIEAEVAEKHKEKKERVARLIDLIKKMDDSQLQSLLQHAEELHGKKKRRHERIPCLVTADCLYKGRAFSSYCKDISLSGVLLETRESVTAGEEVTMTLSLSHHVKPFRVKGEVVRTTSEGVGIEFKPLTQVQEEMVNSMVKKLEQLKK